MGLGVKFNFGFGWVGLNFNPTRARRLLCYFKYLAKNLSIKGEAVKDDPLFEHFPLLKEKLPYVSFARA